MAILCGRHAIDRYDGRYYAMARNLAIELTAAYDAALAGLDVLVMPTLPIVASVIPAADAAPGGVRRPVPGDDRQHGPAGRERAPGDVGSGRSARVPGGPPAGLPAGLMIVGRHFADDMCLRVARAYEAAVGGFPAPPPGR